MTELKFRILEYIRSGRAVKVEGLGIWAPNIALDGTISIQYRPDLGFDYELNQPSVFSGTIINREHIGKTSDELVVMWNEANPTDLVS